MTTAFPTGLDNFQNPGPNDATENANNALDHDVQHSNANDAVEALEAKVGVDNSAVTTSLDYQVRNNLGKPLGLTGATAATRYVGATTTGTPVSGTFAKGDVVFSQTGHVYICTTAGSPGTWTEAGSTPGGTGGMALPDFIVYKSGSNFIARNTTTGNDDFTSTNAASVVQSCHDTFATGGYIGLKSGVTYNATSQVILSTAGVIVFSRPQPGEDQPTNWQVNTALAGGQAAFRLTGSGCAIGGLSIECNSNSDYGVDLRGGGQQAFELNIKEADVANLYVDGPNGAARCTFWNIRSDNPTANGGINYKIDGPDHIAWGLRATGTATNGYALWMDSSRCQISSGHITGTGDAAACVFISGEENRMSDFYFDTGPNGTNGQAHTVIKGSGNYISALIQNAATVTAVNVTSTSLVSGTTYRFGTSTSHNYSVGDAVWLEGFSSSNGFFNGTTQGNVLVTNVSDATHFDANLGATTTFTDSVGTAKKITKYGLLFQKDSAGGFVQGNEVHINYQGKGAGVNNGEFYYAVGFLDETGADATNLTRFSGNKIYANAAQTTRFSNIESNWGTITDSDKVFVDAWQYQQSTTTPMTWRTKSHGITSASTATSWTIQHGLAGAPGDLQVTARADPGTATWYISAIGESSFTITASASITNARWAWKAEM